MSARWETKPGDDTFGWKDLTNRGQILILILVTIALLVGLWFPWESLPWNKVTCPAGQTLELDQYGHPARCVTP